MCLPCEDAVKTSILSKKWRYHWCRRTELTLDGFHWRAKNDLLDPTVKFKKIICQFLTLHDGPITKFTLNIARLESFPNIDNFINFLSRNDIQHLVLRFPKNKLYKLPYSLFTCSQLRHLTLHNCSVHPPSTFQGFDRLISMELCWDTDTAIDTVSSELLEGLISRCPLLEQLVLKISEIFNIIEINAPMLRSFDFTGSISSICLKNVTRLAKVSLLCNDSYVMEEEYFGFAKFFRSCSAVEHLLLNFNYDDCELDEPDDLAARLPFEVNSVKHFCLPCFVLVESYKLSCVLCLIRSFPYLEYFEIKAYDGDDSDIQESLELERFSDVTFSHLREVKLGIFSGTVPEMQLIKLFLAKSPVLVRVLINPYFLDAEPLATRIKIFAEVSKFWRASPKAEVVYRKVY